MTTQQSALARASDVYPFIADTTHATPALVETMHKYCIPKSSRDAEGWLDAFNVDPCVFGDTTLGIKTDRTGLKPILTRMMNNASDSAKSYPLRILGDLEHGAIMFLVDNEEFFTQAVYIASVFHFNKQGKIIRQVDYWDGRKHVVSERASPDEKFPTRFGEDELDLPAAHATMSGVVDKLHRAFCGNDSRAAAALLAPDVVFEDRALRARLEGRGYVESYLQRTLGLLPYGDGATIRSVLGSARGGGYEWMAGKNAAVARHGVMGLELNEKAEITRLTCMWDSRRAREDDLKKLALLVLEP